ncbi:MAG TPA: lysylphosphatidylglycerol synthase transmembrane domain-containing protein [Chryseolinea sp.]|nr:lysylphosphatidylglycerol synthase transmembrane domain-containing protein [Chryseolinea sp.]
MSSRYKVFIQYAIIIAVTFVLIWFSLRGLQVGEGGNKWDYLVQTWQAADKGWLFMMAFICIVSHFVRAIRWKMLLVPVGQKTSLSNSFLSLMVGYLVNLVIPRGGEVSRCYNLYKLEKVPVEISFGTVVLERIVDVICLIILVALSFLVESKKLIEFINTLPINSGDGNSKIQNLILVLAIVAGVFGLSYWFVKKNKRANNFFVKTWHGFKGGMLSVFKLENKGLFIFYSVLIWALYFLMSFAVMMAFPATSVLGFQAVMSLFAIGSIAMAAPLPGGTGSYHVLVPQGLVFLYQIDQTDAVAFTFIFHAWQTIILIVAGVISLIATSIVVKKKSSGH